MEFMAVLTLIKWKNVFPGFILVIPNFSDRPGYNFWIFAIFTPPYWSPAYGSTANSLWCFSKGRRLYGRMQQLFWAKMANSLKMLMEFVAVLTLKQQKWYILCPWLPDLNPSSHIVYTRWFRFSSINLMVGDGRCPEDNIQCEVLFSQGSLSYKDQEKL